jgi:hypothetical protein
MTTSEPNQVEYAERLADALNVCDDYELDSADILDGLATAGLKLVEDEDGDANGDSSPRETSCVVWRQRDLWDRHWCAPVVVQPHTCRTEPVPHGHAVYALASSKRAARDQSALFRVRVLYVTAHTAARNGDRDRGQRRHGRDTGRLTDEADGNARAVAIVP